MGLPLAKYLNVDEIKAQWGAAKADLHARLPEKDAEGKAVKKADHQPHDEVLKKLIARGIKPEAADLFFEELQAQAFAEIKGKS